MPYDYMSELKEVEKYYSGDSLQKRFSLLLTGETNTGKTYILRTARMPVHIDSFDPGGTKSLVYDSRDKGANKFNSLRTPENPDGQIIADTSFEREDPQDPKSFAAWMKAIDRRFMVNYFDHFGTYCLDSATMFGMAVMNYQLGGRHAAGEAPQRNKDYMPQKVFMTTYLRKLMNLPCDFILTGHLREIKKLISLDTKTGIAREEIKYRFYTTGDAVVTIPLLFDEIYVITGKEGREGPKREMLTDSLGTYIARSRLRRAGLLNAVEEPNIKAILKKAGLDSRDKEKLPNVTSP